jgi:hypothetical protein
VGINCSRNVELQKDVAVIVLGASGDLAKKKTVIFALPTFLTTCVNDPIVPRLIRPGIYIPDSEDIW